MVVVAALLAVLAGASNQAPAGENGARQEVAAGAVADATARPSAPGSARAVVTTSTSAVPGSAVAVTGPPTTADGGSPAAAGSGPEPDAEEQLGSAGDDPGPAPTRGRDTAPTSTDPPTTVPPTTAPPAPASLTQLPDVEWEVLGLTNSDRADHGLPPVSRDGCMDADASAWARTMADSSVMAHSPGGGAAVQGCRGGDAYWGDNIGHWQPCFPDEMEAWWMGSPSHRPHILDANYEVVGIGVWSEPDGRCWFQVFFGS